MATADLRNVREPTQVPAPGQRGEGSAEVATGGAAGEAVCGLAAVVLSIVGLAHVLSPFLAAVAALVLGAALLLQGGAMFARFSNLLAQAAGGRVGTLNVGGGTSAGFGSGAAGIVLGILALVGVYPEVLLPVAAIVFGAGLVLGCGTTARLNALEVERCCGDNDGARRVAGEMVSSANGALVLVGLAAIILGIVGLAGPYGLVLSLVAFLCLGAAVSLSGSATSGKMMTMLHR